MNLMKKLLQKLIESALKCLKDQGVVGEDLKIPIQIERVRDKRFGDFASNIAMVLAKRCNQKPKDLAQKFVAVFELGDLVDSAWVAGPGFINFRLKETVFYGIVKQILQEKSDFGRSTKGAGRKIHLEYTSSNPTGPLHVGHGRSAAFGSSIATLLEYAGFTVHREYYVNDAGRQVDILGLSIWLRYLENFEQGISFPENAYQGQYIYDISKKIIQDHGNNFFHPWAQVRWVPDPSMGVSPQDNEEVRIDYLIRKARQLLGDVNFELIKTTGLNIIIAEIRDDLADFGVHYQHWFSEKRLLEENVASLMIDKLRQAGYTYEKEGALWFNATKFGDEKDRVLIRSNQHMTYFATDIAYHAGKFERGYDQFIDIFGADHHGYILRIKAAMVALGYDIQAFTILIVQFATLYHGKKRIPMSTRRGSFVTLRQLREEVGCDAARFFYVMRKAEQHLDFDLELAKSKSNDNPVYYIQYAHARICSVFKQLKAKNLTWQQDLGLQSLDQLQEAEEKTLMRQVAAFPDIIESATDTYEPHQIAYYLRELAQSLHIYYNTHQLIVDQNRLRNARLSLIESVRQILENGLMILGVSAPEKM